MPTPSASILGPRTGDTVAAGNVTLFVAYANFVNGGGTTDTLNCSIGGDSDSGANPNGDGLHQGSANASSSPSPQSVVVSLNNSTELSRQDGINIGNPPVVKIQPDVGDSGGTDRDVKMKKLNKVKGEVPHGLGATSVVVTLYQAVADPNTGVWTISVTNTSPNPNPGTSSVDNNHNWKVDFGVDLDTSGATQYFVQACAKNNNGTSLGCVSQAVSK